MKRAKASHVSPPSIRAIQRWYPRRVACERPKRSGCAAASCSRAWGPYGRPRTTSESCKKYQKLGGREEYRARGLGGTMSHSRPKLHRVAPVNSPELSRLELVAAP